jgi:hypothetical protein
MGMLQNATLLSILGGALSGGVFGGGLSWWLTRARRLSPPSDGRHAVDESISPMDFDHAAQAWAEDRGVPEAAPLVANKLQLGHQLIEYRSRRWMR